MNNINMTEWSHTIMASPCRKAIPIMTHPGIEIIGHTVRDAVTNGDIHADAIIALDKAYPADATTVIMDLTVEAECFGAEVQFEENEVPNVINRLVTDRESVANLQVPEMTSGRLPQYIKANRRVAETITDKPVFAGCIGPFSLAGRLFGMSEFMMEIYMDPESMHILLEKCTKFIINYVRELKNAGVNGVVIAEPAAGLVSNEDCSHFSSVYVKRIVDTLQDDSFMIMLHNCGNTGHCTEAMAETGAAALHFGNRIDMVQALTDSPADMLVMGNLDPAGLFKLGTADEVYNATMQLLRDTAQWPNFVLSSGCDVPPYTPDDNIKAFYKALADYNSTL